MADHLEWSYILLAGVWTLSTTFWNGNPLTAPEGPHNVLEWKSLDSARGLAQRSGMEIPWQRPRAAQCSGMEIPWQRPRARTTFWNGNPLTAPEGPHNVLEWKSLNQSGTEVNYDAVHQHQVCCETVSYKCAICCVIKCVIKVSRQEIKLT